MAKIGIVILNYKTYLNTEKLVKKITSQESHHDLFIQVVDNASPNESYEYLSKNLRQKNIDVYLNDSNSGFAKGNNVGLRLLKAFDPEYALILNNDVLFELSLLDKLVSTYKSIDDCGAISPKQMLPNGKLETFRSLAYPKLRYELISYTHIISRYRKNWEYYENTEHKNIQTVGIIPGCFIFISYKLFESVGFFDESTFLFCEEHFLAKKMKDANKRNYILLDCSYIHDHSKTIKQEMKNLKALELMKKGYILFTKKHRSFPIVKCLLLEIMWLYFKTIYLIKIPIKKLIGKE